MCVCVGGCGCRSLEIHCSVCVCEDAMLLLQVEGVVGTYFANRHADGSQYGSTVVSFDKGGRWNLLTPPALDVYNRPVVCAPVSSSFTFYFTQLLIDSVWNSS